MANTKKPVQPSRQPRSVRGHDGAKRSMDTNSAVTKKTFARSLHVKTVKGYEITKRDIETNSVLRGKIAALEQIGIYPDRPYTEMQYDEPNYSKLITDSPSVIEKRLEETLTKSLVTPNTVISLPDDMRMGHRLGLMYYNELEKEQKKKEREKEQLEFEEDMRLIQRLKRKNFDQRDNDSMI
ncbi:Protein of unknown function [Pyronema omphalodes CBS 100304]|uniref:Uncharacterized protein n=1 Tax=Pyronema omphalodes (strain CBS 100304) TaxID=1076935 RepID=U4L7P9_PYROM|nr:Protein of unknown function [Pyronema omphalodes CBS 100304]